MGRLEGGFKVMNFVRWGVELVCDEKRVVVWHFKGRLTVFVKVVGSLRT